MVIFRDKLSPEIYTHFLRLCLAVRLCSCKTYVAKKNLQRLARTLFAEYCADFVKYYGSSAIVSNVHNICHVSDDVERFGPLSEISTYPFENYLKEIKLNTQASNNPLEQITRRIAELSLDMKNQSIDFYSVEIEQKIWVPELKYEFKSNNDSVFKYVRVTPNVFFSIRKKGDSWFMTRKNEIVQMKFAIKKLNSFFIYGCELISKKDFFTRPYTSGLSDIYLFTDLSLGDNKFYEISEIKAKMMCLSHNDQIVLIPLLHSIDECTQYNYKNIHSKTTKHV